MPQADLHCREESRHGDLSIGRGPQGRRARAMLWWLSVFTARLPMFTQATFSADRALGRNTRGFFSFTDPTSCSMMREKRERLTSEQTRTHGAIGMQSRFDWAVIGGMVGPRPHVQYNCCQLSSHVQPYPAILGIRRS